MSEETRCTDPEKGMLLAAYELGLLPASDQLLFEKHLASCPVCQERLYEMSPFMAAIQSDPGQMAARLTAEARRRAMGEAADEAAGEVPRERAREEPAGGSKRAGLGDWARAVAERLWPARGWSGTWRTLVPATVVAVVLVAIMLQQGSDPSWGELARLEPVPYVPMLTRAGGDSEAEDLFRQGMARYVEGGYSGAARLLSKAARRFESAGAYEQPGGLEDALRGAVSDQAAFFAGLSFLLSREPDSATVYLDLAASSRLPAIADRSRWCLAQGSLLLNDPASAIEHLEPLASGSPGYSVQAGELLDELREAME